MFIRRAFHNNLPILRAANQLSFGICSIASAMVNDTKVLSHIENQTETKFDLELKNDI
jgi:hypothetical protein